jgi:hypothetical protein
MACPVCRCEKFYIKDPQDSFETREFEYKNGLVSYADDAGDAVDLEVTPACEIFCQRCAWHGSLNQIAGR